jgi:hypothetical protein
VIKEDNYGQEDKNDQIKRRLKVNDAKVGGVIADRNHGLEASSSTARG